MQFEHPGASHSEAATGACGIAVYTPVDAASAYTDILPTDFNLLPQRSDEFPCEDVTIKTDRNQQTPIDLLPNLAAGTSSKNANPYVPAKTVLLGLIAIARTSVAINALFFSAPGVAIIR